MRVDTYPTKNPRYEIQVYKEFGLIRLLDKQENIVPMSISPSKKDKKNIYINFKCMREFSEKDLLLVLVDRYRDSKKVNIKTIVSIFSDKDKVDTLNCLKLKSKKIDEEYLEYSF